MIFNFEKDKEVKLTFIPDLPKDYGYWLFVLNNGSVVTGYYNHFDGDPHPTIITLYGETKSYCRYVDLDSQIAGYFSPIHKQAKGTKTTMNYEMYTDEGNKAIADLLDEMAIALKEKPTKDLRLILNQKMLRISEVHGEIFDTEPRYHISIAMQKQAREVLNIELDADYWGLI